MRIRSVTARVIALACLIYVSEYLARFFVEI